MSDLYVSDKSYKELQERIEELETEVDKLQHRSDYMAQVIDQRNAECSRQFKQIERLRAALKWEAACAGDECAYERGQFCFEYEPESPDLPIYKKHRWCTYCRITAALKGAEKDE